jgi:hypothetical protein
MATYYVALFFSSYKNVEVDYNFRSYFCYGYYFYLLQTVRAFTILTSH